MKLARPARLSDDVFQALEARIRAGAFVPGEQLPPEARLAEDFGVSRSVVREALARLKGDGFVFSRQGAGVFVAPRPGTASFRLDNAAATREATVHDVLELRRIVESAAAELAAQRRSQEDLEAIAAALARMESAVAQGRDATEDDDAFHRAIGAATGNPLIGRFVEFLGGHIEESRRPTWSADGRAAGLASAAQAEHRRIYEAIAAGDAIRARNAAARHLQRVSEQLGGRRARAGAASAVLTARSMDQEG